MKAVLVCVLAVAASTWGLQPVSEQYQRGWRKAFNYYQNMDSNPVLQAMFKEHTDKRSDFQIPDPIFNCDTSIRKKSKPTSVHALSPWDVGLVAAIGDSVTAGYGVGANNVIEVLNQNRGESWSVGGNGDASLSGPNKVITLTNIIRNFNPDVSGFSIGMGGTGPLESGLNRAEGGATNRNMLDQAVNLVNRINSNYNMDDWKIITLFVGGNDLCASCNNMGAYGPEAYRDGIFAAVDYLKTNAPYSLVNVVVMFDVTPLIELSTGFICDLLQGGFCSCATNPITRPQMRLRQLEYHRLLEEHINQAGYDSEDFAVVLQPHMRDLRPPRHENGEYILEFLSHDCFHPSRPAHHLFAMGLWDVMFEPVGDKTMITEIDAINPWTISCPSEESPYFFTNTNSMLRKKVEKAHAKKEE